VEQGLISLDGVYEATVNLATEKATVGHDPDLIDVETISNKVKDLGYAVIGSETPTKEGNQKTTVLVGGMTCAAPCYGKSYHYS
jgi:Cu+-exporting ATPase